jgi:zinc protease
VPETMDAKLKMLYDVSNYNLPDDYAKSENIVKQVPRPNKTVVTKYLNPNKMIYLIVGDAERS